MFRITSLILGIFFSVGFVSSQTNETVPPASPRPPNLNPPPRSTSSPPPPVATPNQSPPPSVPPPAVIPNQLSPPNVPPPPLSSFCPIYLAQIVTYCGADVYSENANFSAPSCCGSVYQANQGSCFSTVVAPCTVSSSTLNGLTFICGLAYSQLYLPQGSVCVPPPSPQSPPEISPPFSKNL